MGVASSSLEMCLHQEKALGAGLSCNSMFNIYMIVMHVVTAKARIAARRNCVTRRRRPGQRDTYARYGAGQSGNPPASS